MCYTCLIVRIPKRQRMCQLEKESGRLKKVTNSTMTNTRALKKREKTFQLKILHTKFALERKEKKSQVRSFRELRGRILTQNIEQMKGNSRVQLESFAIQNIDQKHCPEGRSKFQKFTQLKHILSDKIEVNLIISLLFQKIFDIKSSLLNV